MTSATDNRTTELLPCPFCGGEARLICSAPDWYFPACMNRECACDWTDSYQTKAEAIAAWNSRAERTCVKFPSLTEQTCIVRRKGFEAEFGYWRCSECNCENFEGARYCMGCGRKVVGVRNE